MKKNKITGSMRCQCCGEFCQEWEYDKYCGKRITSTCDEGNDLWFEQQLITKDELRSCWVGGMYYDDAYQDAIISWNYVQRVLEVWNMSNRENSLDYCYDAISKDVYSDEY